MHNIFLRYHLRHAQACDRHSIQWLTKTLDDIPLAYMCAATETSALPNLCYLLPFQNSDYDAIRVATQAQDSVTCPTLV